jgi:hypothetical protein
MRKKPNILYMMMDQQKASAAGYLGNTVVPSPFIDSMASDGIAFSNAYSPSSEFSYIFDPDNGDEAYDLRNDPGELDNLLLSGSAPDWTKKLRERISDWEENCLSLRKELGVIPGDRGFYKGWE